MAKLIGHESVRRKRGRGNGNRNASIEAARAFEAGVGRDVEADRERKVEKLHAKIGQLAVERDFLAKSPEDERAGLRRAMLDRCRSAGSPRTGATNGQTAPL